jgi:hypothetical protein
MTRLRATTDDGAGWVSERHLDNFGLETLACVGPEIAPAIATDPLATARPPPAVCRPAFRLRPLAHRADRRRDKLEKAVVLEVPMPSAGRVKAAR